MLDAKGKAIQKEINLVLGFVIEFRSFVKKYIPRNEGGEDGSDSEEEGDKSRILQVTSPDFIQNY